MKKSSLFFPLENMCLSHSKQRMICNLISRFFLELISGIRQRFIIISKSFSRNTGSSSLRRCKGSTKLFDKGYSLTHLFQTLGAGVISYIGSPNYHLQFSFFIRKFFLQFSTEQSTSKLWWKPLLSDHLIIFIKDLSLRLHITEDLLHVFLQAADCVNFKSN